MKNEYKSFLKLYMQRYIDHRTSLGYSENSYLGTFISLDKFLSCNYSNGEVFTKKMFDEWILENSCWSNATTYRSIIQVVNLCEFISHDIPDVYIPPREIAPKVLRYEPAILSDDEIKYIFDCIDNYVSPPFSPSLFHLTGPVLFRLIFLCGLRPNEPCALLRDDIDLNNGKINISNTKKHKSRQIYMSEDMLDLCKKYDKRISLLVPDRKYFFILKNGKKLKTYNIEYYMNTIKKRLDNPKLKKFRPYDFRHNFATRSILNYLETNNDVYSYIPLLSAYMGHDSFEDTFYYISLLPSYIKNIKQLDWDKINECIPEIKL